MLSYVRNYYIVYIVQDVSNRSALDDVQNWVSFVKNIEEITTNHDQQITHETEVYAVYKGEKINDILKAANVEVRPNNNPEKPVIKLTKTEPVNTASS